MTLEEPPRILYRKLWVCDKENRIQVTYKPQPKQRKETHIQLHTYYGPSVHQIANKRPRVLRQEPQTPVGQCNGHAILHHVLFLPPRWRVDLHKNLSGFKSRKKYHMIYINAIQQTSIQMKHIYRNHFTYRPIRLRSLRKDLQSKENQRRHPH